MHELLRPFNSSDLAKVLQEVSADHIVQEAKEAEGLILFTTIIPIKEAEEFSGFFKKDKYYIKHSFKSLKETFSLASGGLPRFSPEMLPSDFKFPTLLNFEIQKKKYYLPLSEALQAAEIRCPLTKLLFNITNEISSPGEAMKKILPLLKELSEHVLWKKHPELKKEEVMKDLVKKFKGDDKFLKFWIKEQDIKTEQLTCKHSFAPSYRADTALDKNSPICKKCLFNPTQSFEGEECKAAFKFWSAARKAYLL